MVDIQLGYIQVGFNLLLKLISYILSRHRRMDSTCFSGFKLVKVPQ